LSASPRANADGPIFRHAADFFQFGGGEFAQRDCGNQGYRTQSDFHRFPPKWLTIRRRRIVLASAFHLFLFGAPLAFWLGILSAIQVPV
jgi:hypothetical protein